MEKKKINLKLIIIAIIIFIVLVIIMLLTNKKEETPPPKPTESTPTKIEITNELMKELDTKISLLKYSNYCEIGNNIDYYMYDCLYRQELTTTNDLSETYKLYTLILSLDRNNENKINYVVGNIVVDDYTFRYTQQYTPQEIKEEYENIYGDSSNLSFETLNTITKFPYVKYDAKRDKIFYQTVGEKIEKTTNEVIEYISDYKSDETNVYVNVSTAFIAPTGEGNYGIYKDYQKTTLIDTEPNLNYEKEKIINKDNYMNFNTYQYTFTKDETTGKLLFKQVELLK